MSTARNKKPKLSVVARPEDDGPPRNVEIERQVLGAVMMDAAAVLPEVAPILAGVEPFWLADHESVWRAVLELHAAGSLIDPVMVMDQLERSGELARVGGFDALTAMVHSVGSIDNARHHATILRSKAVKRRLLQETLELAEAIRAEGETADALRSIALARLTAVPSEVVCGAEGYATLADALAVIGETRWAWKHWIAQGVLNLLSARGGVGKTRFAMDLARRLWLGLAMPDGSENPFPPETPTLWLFVDRNWRAAGDVAKSFGMPAEAILLPTSKDRPIHTPELDDPATLIALEQQIREQRPGLVIIDTITYATGYKVGQAEEAKLAFDGLMDLAARTGVGILALTHVNNDGQTLGRRIEERARVNMHLTCPDPNQKNRLRFWVEKSEAEKPEPLGITILADRNEYDTSPPVAPDPERKPTGPAPTKSLQDAQWLISQLREAGGPIAVTRLIDVARTDKILTAPTAAKPKPSLTPLYNAKERVPSVLPGWSVTEAELDAIGGKTRKYWQLEQDEEDAQTQSGAF